ncbi:MAG: hypothetical protein HQL87_12220 [Magnetococcales bacterium]|nr:hypothetical protein [Magnetococcales bacterium]
MFLDLQFYQCWRAPTLFLFFAVRFVRVGQIEEVWCGKQEKWWVSFVSISGSVSVSVDRRMGMLESPEKSLQPVEFVGLYFSTKNGVFVNNFNMLREFSPDFLQGTHAWVWVAFAPEWRLFLGFVVGKRVQKNANILIKRVHHIINGRLPLFTSDQLPEYRTALLEAYGQWVQPERTSQRGRCPKRQLVPCPGLLYAQVVKRKERGHLVDITTKPVFGDADTIRARLASFSTSNSINTSFVERGNLVLRQGNRRLTRKTNGFSKDLIWLEKQLWMSLAYYHFILPHQSLRRKLSVEEPTRGSGSHRRWQSITPAMAAGMTDHVWSTSELLSYRIPTTFLDHLNEVEHLFSSVWFVHHGE